MQNKLFHIDRLNSLKDKKLITCFNDYSFTLSNSSNDLEDGVEEEVIKLSNSTYPEGISEHGNHFLFREACNDSLIESIFELVRQKDYPNMPSRFQSFFAVDIDGLTKLRQSNSFKDTEYPIYEVNADRYVRLDMNWLAGTCFLTINYFAQKYWSGEISKDPKIEYILIPPISILKKIEKE